MGSNDETIRNSAKAIIIEKDQLLLTKNRDDAGCFYLFPGGGQALGEELQKSVIRECVEEIGCEINVGELIFVREYIGKNHEFSKWDDDLHQVEFYFRCSLKTRPANKFNGANPDKTQVDVEWVDIGRLDEIRLYPKEIGRKLKENSLKPVYLGDVS